ncbi:MAG: hypothetical protein VXY23_19405 [Pseudomonadota bacterium]|nr:hypothetical protein [Pseudomonadota bacterium]
MFDEVKKKLSELEGITKVQIDLELDENGYFDRKCPASECGAAFKVNFEDWKNIVRDEEVFCPICRHADEATEWNTLEQLEYIKNFAVSHFQRKLAPAFEADARNFNRSQTSKSFIKISLTYKPGNIAIPVPASALEILTQEYTCERCSCSYASLGGAFFCPACGHNSAFDSITNSIETVRKTLVAIPAIRATLQENLDKNAAEDSIRHIYENGLVKIVSAFQRFAEACFKRLSNAASFKVRKNLFQNLKESDELWRAATGTGYTELLDLEEYSCLSLYFQQRHLLAHLDGIVDQAYIDKSGDNRFSVGQRLVVSEAGVSDLADITSKLCLELKRLT